MPYHRQLDFVEDVSLLIPEASSDLTNWRGAGRLLNSVWVWRQNLIYIKCRICRDGRQRIWQEFVIKSVWQGIKSFSFPSDTQKMSDFYLKEFGEFLSLFISSLHHYFWLWCDVMWLHPTMVRHAQVCHLSVQQNILKLLQKVVNNYYIKSILAIQIYTKKHVCRAPFTMTSLCRPARQRTQLWLCESSMLYTQHPVFPDTQTLS